MTQLLRITHDVDRRDLPVSDFQSRRLEQFPTIDADKAWQAVDHDRPQQNWSEMRFACNSCKQPQNAVHTVDDVAEGRHLPSTIGMDCHVFSQHRGQRDWITIARSGKKGARDPVSLGKIDLESRAIILNMSSR